MSNTAEICQAEFWHSWASSKKVVPAYKGTEDGNYAQGPASRLTDMRVGVADRVDWSMRLWLQRSSTNSLACLEFRASASGTAVWSASRQVARRRRWVRRQSNESPPELPQSAGVRFRQRLSG